MQLVRLDTEGYVVKFAYLFARFPSFTQTFCYREVAEMERQAEAFPVWSIRVPDDAPDDCPAALAQRVAYLPGRDALQAELRGLRAVLRGYPLSVAWALRRWRNKNDRLRLLEAAWLGARLRAQGIEHVHTHFAGISARTAWWIRKFYGISYSFTAHANDVFCGDDSASSVSIDALVQDARFVVTVSDFSRAWLRDQHADAADKVFRVYNGLAFDDGPSAAELSARAVGTDDLPTITSVGRLIEKKGFEDLIDACAALKGAGLRFLCRIVGEGPLRSALETRIERLGCSACIELCGALPQDAVRALLASSSLFVLACVPEADGGMDNLPTVIVEAMAYGLPVVSTRLAAVPEMVEHGATGWLVPPRDSAALGEAIKTLLLDPAMAQRFGSAGQALGRRKFALNHTVGRLHDLIQSGR